MPRMLPLLCTVIGLTLGAPVGADDDDKPAATSVGTATPALSIEQQQAVGLTVLHPLPASAGEQIDGYGVVLDPALLVADAGRLQSTRAAERAASTEAQRLSALYHGAADTSLRSVESAQATQIEAQTQAQIASSTFALQWGPVGKFSDAQRVSLIEALTSGRSVLLRADLPGRLRLGTVPQTAQLTVDGTQVPARVLGTLARSGNESQSVGLLLQSDRAPPGLGAGARVLVTLHGAANSGVLVPSSALLYGDEGPYVYRRLDSRDNDGKQQYAPVAVKLIQAAGTAWVVQGIDSDDVIVANGAGVLWSLQGLGSFSAEEEDHD